MVEPGAGPRERLPVPDRLRRLSVSTVSDAMDKLGIAGQVPHIRPLDPRFRLGGPAFTVLYGPCGEDGGTVGDYVDDVPSGSVIVIDNQGREDATVWGGILSTHAARLCIAGTVIDGVCRDVPTALTANYPLFSRGAWMRTGKDRVRMEAVGVPVSLADVTVSPGDLVLGDADGVVVVPRDRAAEVVEVGEIIERAEGGILKLLANGGRLDRARQDLGYHTLQRDDPM